MSALLKNGVANTSAGRKRSRSPASQDPPALHAEPAEAVRRPENKKLAQENIKKCVDELLDIQKQISDTSRAPGGSKEAVRKPFYDVLQKMEPLLYILSPPHEYANVEATRRYQTGDYSTDLRNVYATLQVYKRTINLFAFDPFLLTYTTFVLLSLLPTLTNIEALTTQQKPDVLCDVLLHALKHLHQHFPSVLEHIVHLLLTDRVVQSLLPVCYASSLYTDSFEIVLSLERSNAEGLTPIEGVEMESGSMLFTRKIKIHNQLKGVLFTFGLCHLFSQPFMGSPYLLSVKQYGLLTELECGLLAVRWEHLDDDREVPKVSNRELARVKRYGKLLPDAAGSMLLHLLTHQHLAPELSGSVVVRAVLQVLKQKTRSPPRVSDWSMQVLQYFVSVSRYTSFLAVLCASTNSAYKGDVGSFLMDLTEAVFTVVDHLLCPRHLNEQEERACPQTEKLSEQLSAAEYLVAMLESAVSEVGGGVFSQVIAAFMSAPSSLLLVRRLLSHKIPSYFYMAQGVGSLPLRLLALVPLGIYDSPGFASLLQSVKESSSRVQFAFVEMSACVGRARSQALHTKEPLSNLNRNKRSRGVVEQLNDVQRLLQMASSLSELSLILDIFLIALEPIAQHADSADAATMLILQTLDSEWKRLEGADAGTLLPGETYALLFLRICSRASCGKCVLHLNSICKQVEASSAPAASVTSFSMLKYLYQGAMAGFTSQFASKLEVPAADGTCVATLMDHVVNRVILQALKDAQADAETTIQVLQATTNFVLALFGCCATADRKNTVRQEEEAQEQRKSTSDVVVDVDDSDVEEVTTTATVVPTLKVATKKDCVPSRGIFLGMIAQLSNYVFEGALCTEVELEVIRLVAALLILHPTTTLPFALSRFVIKIASHESMSVRQDIGCFAVYRLMRAALSQAESAEPKDHHGGVATVLPLMKVLKLAELHDNDMNEKERECDAVLKFANALLCRHFSHFFTSLEALTGGCSTSVLLSDDDGQEAKWAYWCREQGTALFGTCVHISRLTQVSSLLQCDALETACDLLHVLGWSVENVCQRYPQIVTAPLFRSLCQSEDVDAEIVVRNSLATLLGPFAIDKVRPEEGEKITTFMKKNFSDDLFSTEITLPPLIAYVLYAYGGSDAARKAELLLQLFHTVQLADEDIRPHFNKHLAAIVLNILSLEANAQQQRIEEMPPDSISADKLHSNVSYLVFSEAVRQAVSVAQSEPTRSALEQALSAPMTTEATAQVLVRTVFDVVDSVSGFIIDKKRVDVHGYNRVAPFCTLQRWLLAFSSLVCFMGTQHSLIAAKVGAMLDSCPLDERTAPYVALVWYHFITQCSDSYLQEHAFSLVIDIVNVELSAPQAHMCSAAVAQLNEILGKVLTRLVQVTASDNFWASCSTVLGTRSGLIGKMQRDKHVASLQGGEASAGASARRLLQRSPKRRGRAAPSESEMAQLEAKKEAASQIIMGFLTVMQSSTKKCRRVFVRCFHSYLQSLSPVDRVYMTVAAEAFPLLISALLDCSREFGKEDAEDVQLALQSIGLLGAVSPHNLPNLSNANPNPSSAEAFLTKSQRNRHLDPQKVIFWECFAFYLLSEYCPKALSNTASNDMHDRLAFAIQEILRLCTKQQRKSRSGTMLRDDEFLHTQELEGYWWWAELPENVKKMLEGFLSTRYHTCIYQAVEPRSPLYLPNMNVHVWSFALFNFLLVRSGGAHGEMFATLRNVAKRDFSLMEFLLPYVLVHLLEFGTEEDKQDVLLEFNIVFDAATPQRHGGRVEGKEAFEPLSMRLESNVESPRKNASFVDAHVQLLVNILEDISQLRWQLLTAVEENKNDKRREGDIKRWASCADACADFLTRVELHRRVVACMEIGNNVRALRSLESQRYLPSAADALKKAPLQRIFAALGDRDSSRCIHHISHPTLEEEAFSCENNGDWYLALQNCDLVLQQKKNSVPHMLTALRCLRQLGQLHLMSRYAQAQLTVSDRKDRDEANNNNNINGIPTSHDASTNNEEEEEEDTTTTTTASTSVSPGLDATTSGTSSRGVLQWYANEASWRLGEWDHIHEDPTLPVSLAVPVKKWAQYVQKQDRSSAQEVRNAVQRECISLGGSILSTTREGYEQGYPSIALLHAFSDLDIACEILGKKRRELGNEGAENDVFVSQVVRVLTERLEVTEPTLEAREPLLSLHRVLYKTLNLPSKVADVWLVYAHLLKDAGLYEAAWRAAQQAVIEGEDIALNPDYYRMSAQLLYDMGNSRQAVEFAQERVDDGKVPAQVRSELKVMMTNWSLETGSQSTTDVTTSYMAALTLHKWDGAYYHLALFYDKVYTTCAESLGTRGPDYNANTDQEQVDLISAYAMCAVENYGRALQTGVSSTSVSLPRLLTLWLDSTATLHKIGERKDGTGSNADKVCKDFNGKVNAMLNGPKGIPLYVLMSALPQLLSRLCHPSAIVKSTIIQCVSLLASKYPQVCLWSLLPIALSEQKERADNVKRHLLNSFGKVPTQGAEMACAFQIINALITLCRVVPEKAKQNFKLNEQPFIAQIQETLQTHPFILPTLANLTPSIDNGVNGRDVFDVTSTFFSFKDEVVVMVSLQKPKRFWVNTREGDSICFLCKSNDEPRKDIRVMELAALINSFFLTDAQAGRRMFNLRRYAVAALNDDCALIEWMDHTQAFRSAVERCYALDKSGIPHAAIRQLRSEVEMKKKTKHDIYTKDILPFFPRVFHQWFDRLFVSNQAWYDARTLYTQSNALWSMVGHIVGLGDRHGENLMLDVMCGEVCHVDFACMFDKGETLNEPERVRFRLTPNVVDAMGILGTDGPFRANCEIALRCQVKNKNAIMSVVETLLHDPLVEWMKTTSRSGQTDPRPLVQRVKRRLDGYLDLFTEPREKDKLVLNVEGQVAKLINHASSVENLAEMYTWWMPWL